MISVEAALEKLCRTRTLLRDTLNGWPGGDLAFIEDRNVVLRKCAADLQQFHDSLQVSAFKPSQEMRAVVVEIRDSVRKLTRVVDVSSAFVQGLAVFAGASTAYNSTGQIERETVRCGLAES